MLEKQAKISNFQHGLPRKYREWKNTPLGDKYLIRPKLSVDEKGNKIAEPGEKLDLHALIQEAAGTTDIAAIAARYQAGDIDCINVAGPGFNGDSTIIPKDLYDVKGYQKVYADAAANFAKLPDDIKVLFNNDSAQFLNSVLDGSVSNIMNTYKANKPADPEPQQKDGE